MPDPSLPDALPLDFHVSVGGFPGTTCSLRLRGNALIYSSGYGDDLTELIELTPTPRSWAAFRQSLDKLGVWRWQSSYANPGILDGEQWALSLRYRDQQIECDGSNCYPGPDGQAIAEPRHTAEFRSLLQAITSLTDNVFGAPPRVYQALDIVRRVCALGEYDSNVIGMAAEIIAEDVYGMTKRPRGSRDIDGSWFSGQDQRTVQVKAWSEARVRRYRHGTFFRVDETSGTDELLVLLIYSSKVGYEELYKGPTKAIGKLEKSGLTRAIRFDSMKSKEQIIQMLGPRT